MAALESPAFDLVVQADHPAPDAGGPCATCAFRPGTEANTSEHTVTLAKMCVEGIEPFDCHEQKRLCRGWIAAVNLIAANGGLSDEASRHWREVNRSAADLFGRCIDAAVEADRQAAFKTRSAK